MKSKKDIVLINIYSLIIRVWSSSSRSFITIKQKATPWRLQTSLRIIKISMELSYF